MELANVEIRHHFGRDCHAGHDDVGASRIQTRHRQPLGGRQFDQLIEQVFEFTACHDFAVHRARSGDTLPRQQHARNVRECAAGPDHPGAAPFLDGESRTDLFTHRLAQLVDAAESCAFAQECFGRANGAEWHRQQSFHQAISRQRELHGPTADVARHHATMSDIEVRLCAAE